eukprot:TRINITY_DN2933_c0_g2_i1.p3 TRINITY_DN2933_c0_g2~~TRINITY_DN2933_c0_g2_i1.p3  ORF type:complete len:104 (-),score=7.02 TRINITY_DN2933_c0_g2_i1:184-495(-)
MDQILYIFVRTGRWMWWLFTGARSTKVNGTMDHIVRRDREEEAKDATTVGYLMDIMELAPWEGLTRDIEEYECKYCDLYKETKGKYVNRAGYSKCMKSQSHGS